MSEKIKMTIKFDCQVLSEERNIKKENLTKNLRIYVIFPVKMAIFNIKRDRSQGRVVTCRKKESGMATFFLVEHNSSSSERLPYVGEYSACCLRVLVSHYSSLYNYKRFPITYFFFIF